MDQHGLVVGLMAGAVALVFGLVPGLFNGLTLGVRNFREALRLGALAHPQPLTKAEMLQRPLGLALIGAIIIAFTTAAYVLN